MHASFSPAPYSPKQPMDCPAHRLGRLLHSCHSRCKSCSDGVSSDVCLGLGSRCGPSACLRCAGLLLLLRCLLWRLLIVSLTLRVLWHICWLTACGHFSIGGS